MGNNLKISDLYDLNFTLAKDYLKSFTYPWEALGSIKDAIIRIGNSLNKNEYTEVYENVWIHKSAKIAPTAFLGAPCIIAEGAELRHCAFIRGNALVGKGCVVGNSTELKNVILFDGVQVPHYNYVGDSILGHKAHMGAGSITSNVKCDRTFVMVKDKTNSIATGLKKFGAILGDCVEVGCNSVLNPGTVIGRNSNIYPMSCVRGVVPANSIYKSDGKIVAKSK